MDSFGQLGSYASLLFEWPESLPTPLISRSHNFNTRPYVTQMSSARVRKRRNHDDAVELINVSWNFSNDQFSEFKTFFDDSINNGADNFLLVTYELSPTPHYIRVVTREVNFYGAKYSGERDDNLHNVTAILEVVDSDVYEIENWFDPVPPIPENPLPENPVEFTSVCRDEFRLTYDDLEQETIYGIEISDSEDGLYVPHIYFALQTDDEKASRTKVLTINNDYEGEAWFRMVQVSSGGSPAYFVMTRPSNPQASVLPAPIITISNLSDITTVEMIQALGSAALGMAPLFGDDLADVSFVTPLSLIEDKMIWLTDTYRRASKKYAQRQGWVDSNDRFGDLVAEKTPGVNIITITNQPAGSIFTFTRDNSDPQIDTYMPRLQSLANNVQAQDHRFGGVVKARYFKDGCQSPLCTVLIDKVMREIPTIKSVVAAKGVSGYCDYPIIDSVTGLPSESGNSCNVLWGGDCAFEDHIVSLGWSGGSVASNMWSPDLSRTSLRRHVKNRVVTTYLSWPIDSISAQYWDFSSFDWFNKTFNKWDIAPRTHNWAITNTLALVMYPIGPDESVCEGDEAVAAVFMAACSFEVGNALPPPPSVACHSNIDLELTYSRFDIIRATQWKENPRDVFWFDSEDQFVAPIPTAEPEPPAVPLFPFDDFEAYLDTTNATTATLDFDAGADWSGAWTVRNGTATLIGYDLWESYTAGALTLWTGDLHTFDPSYQFLDDGEGWEEGTANEWHMTEPQPGIVYYDTFETYANGAPAFNALSGGYGFEAGEFWRFQNDLVGGEETWETYANGAFVGANTGTNMIAESWISR